MAVPATVTFQPTLSTWNEDASMPGVSGGSTNVKKVYDVEFVNADDTQATIQHDFGNQHDLPGVFNPIVISNVLAMGPSAAAQPILDFVMDGSGNQLGVSKNNADDTATFRIIILDPQSVLAQPAYLIEDLG